MDMNIVFLSKKPASASRGVEALDGNRPREAFFGAPESAEIRLVK